MAVETVAEQWADYSSRVFRGLGQVSAVQIAETKQAFYAGAFSMLMTVHALKSSAASGADGAKLLAALTAELEKYHRDEIKTRNQRN